MTLTAAAGFDLGDPAFQRDPYPVLDAVREAGTGVHPIDGLGAIAILRHADVAAVLRDAAVYSSRWLGRIEDSAQASHVDAVMRGNLLFTDPPDHSRLRGLVNRAFTPKAVARLRSMIEATAQQLLADLAPGTEVDLIEHYAMPLPIDVIAELLAVPAADRHRFARWSDAATLHLAPHLAPERRAEAASATSEFVDYIAAVIQQRRVSPGDDFLSGLVHASLDGERLRDMEVVQLVQLLLVAGNETTRSVLASAAALLVRHPAQLAAVRADPSLLPTLVEEVLRFEPPVPHTFRVTTVDTVLGGVSLPAGQPVLVGLAAANRDPRVFDRADHFDVARDPNRHLSFAWGPHYCLGAPLARLELQLALQALISRFGAAPTFVEEPVYRADALARGLPRLLVTL